MNAAPDNVTKLLPDSTAGSPQALAELMPLVYAELKRLAWYHLRLERSDHTLQATALVHEAYLRLVDQRTAQSLDRNQFVRLASQLMRRVLVDYSRGHHAAKRGGYAGKIYLKEAEVAVKGRGADVVAVDRALDRLEQLDPLQASLVELRFFGGLSIEETASVLGISPATVKRHWNVAKAWLARELRSGLDV